MNWYNHIYHRLCIFPSSHAALSQWPLGHVWVIYWPCWTVQTDQLSDFVIHFLANLFQPPQLLPAPTQWHTLQSLMLYTLFQYTTSSGSSSRWLRLSSFSGCTHCLPDDHAFLTELQVVQTSLTFLCLHYSHHRKFPLVTTQKFSRFALFHVV